MPGLMPMFSMANVAKHIDRFKDSRIQAGIWTLANIGEEFVDKAREHTYGPPFSKTYEDDTSNLRGSIGYAILFNGEIQQEDLEGKLEGQTAAKELISELAQTYDDGLVLVGFAGMSYAAAVETLGFDVITGSVPAAAKLKTELMEGLGL